MKCAYVTLVMLGDRYVPGAVALAKSLICHGCVHAKVCMVTADVSLVGELAKFYDAIVRVPHLHFPCGKMLTERQRHLYGSWINYAFTKWQCLTLADYDKLVYLDADHVVVKNIDHLFASEAPALCFSNTYNSTYERHKHGAAIDNLSAYLRTERVLCFTGTMVLRPDSRLHSTIVGLLNGDNKLLVNDNRFNNGFEEVVFVQALVELDMPVTQLSVLYCWNAGDYASLKSRQPFVINYYGDRKPWEHAATYMDVYIWRYFYNQ
uniref:PlxyGVORF36 protein n=1 Tax=Plutella xylostella granulovirus TaxID=98383 RepID=A0A1B2CSE3_9BBAC|nr:PlxyGVORF36 protein [Plutella xylostella granulovirus]